ncbi:tripartite motif-containing protein 16-like [Cyprinus carpio]|uniref:Tripartite motif-containing protein 16-like n=1 Tax=Cyprinus carpio TaxID=7962 RepID=A0A9Q9YU91_CYPCA|nr:tripartite motif-containing protein 16-like [Cyprinus carpio]
MAEARFSQDEFLCSVCLDLLKDPVTTSCGHSYCKICITDCWDQEDQKRVYSCPQCRQTFRPRPALSTNTMLAEVVEKLKKNRLSADCDAGAGDVQCDVCSGRKYRAVKSCLVCLNSYCQNHLEQHESWFKGKRHNLTEATGRLQEMICQKHEKLLEIFCRTDQKCICVLCTVIEHKNHDIVSAADQRTEKQKQLKEMQKTFQQRIQQRCLLISTVTFNNIDHWTRMDFLQYSHQLTPDLNTVNKLLRLSKNNRVITFTNTAQSYPDHPDRFDVRQVLCSESVCGRCYWELEWSGSVFGGVCISVSYKSISRKGRRNECLFGYNDQSWSLICTPSRYSFIHNNIVTVLSVKPISSRIGVYDDYISRIGVFVDHSAGTLSFYSVSDTMSLIHTVQTTFTQPLYPGFAFGSGSSVKLC